MANQALKFEFNGEQCKMFFRYPDRVVSKLSAEEIAAINAEDESIQFKKSQLEAVLNGAENIPKEGFRIVFERSERKKRKGTGPITTEFHIVKEIGVTEDKKSIFEEIGTPSKVTYHTSSKRNSYEKARQYAIHKYFADNNITPDDLLYDLVVNAYETRCENAVRFVKQDEIEELYA